LEASKVSIETTVPASRKLQREDAQALLAKASNMIVAKGKKVVEFKGGKTATDEAIDAMLGSTGNLRAPTSVVGKTLLVGFNEDAFNSVFN
jgi:arsenate reductase-like glutaredoxin family protein